MNGLIHIYEGDGKGKTTAAIGLSIRCAGSGERVLFSQFLKNDQSSEMKILTKLDSIEVVSAEECFGFTWGMSEETKQKARVAYDKLLDTVTDKVTQQEYRMLVLDEILDAYHLELINRDKLISFLKNKPEQLEVVMTGRNPSQELIELADYVSNMKKVKHPFDRGMKARIGIEK